MVEIAGCITPTGDFNNSCENIYIDSYVSSDDLMPDACILKAKCPTMFSGLPKVDNKIYYPKYTKLTNVVNNNGTLFYSEHSLTMSLENSISKSKIDCATLGGSYKKTCSVETAKYKSTDPNLKYTDLCKAELSCKTLDSKQSSSMVYFNINTKSVSVQKIENCDGFLVIGNIDNRCSGEDKDKIKSIAENHGKFGVVKL